MEWYAQNLGHYIVTRETRADRVGGYFRRLGDKLLQWFSDVMANSCRANWERLPCQELRRARI